MTKLPIDETTIDAHDDSEVTRRDSPRSRRRSRGRPPRNVTDEIIGTHFVPNLVHPVETSLPRRLHIVFTPETDKERATRYLSMSLLRLAELYGLQLMISDFQAEHNSLSMPDTATDIGFVIGSAMSDDDENLTFNVTPILRHSEKTEGTDAYMFTATEDRLVVNMQSRVVKVYRTHTIPMIIVANGSELVYVKEYLTEQPITRQSLFTMFDINYHDVRSIYRAFPDSVIVVQESRIPGEIQWSVTYGEKPIAIDKKYLRAAHLVPLLERLTGMEAGPNYTEGYKSKYDHDDEE